MMTILKEVVTAGLFLVSLIGVMIILLGIL